MSFRTLTLTLTLPLSTDLCGDDIELDQQFKTLGSKNVAVRQYSSQLVCRLYSTPCDQGLVQQVTL